MKRYYISRRIGEGTQENPYNSELRVFLKLNWPNEPHFIKQIIAHTIPWCLHKYDLSQSAHDDVAANLEGAFSFPTGALDRKLLNISAERRTAIRTKLESIGFELSWATLDNTVRDVLEYVAHSIQLSEWADVQISAGNFNTNKRVGDIPPEARQRIAAHLEILGIDTAGIIPSTTLKDAARLLQRNANGTLRLLGMRRKKPYLFFDEDNE